MHLTWAKGGEATLVSLDGETVVLRSTTPSPPGARLEATVVAGGEPAPLSMKSYGTRREEDGSFTLRGRIITLTREMRERLSSLVE